MPFIPEEDNDEISGERRDTKDPMRFGGITIMIVSGD